MQESGRTQQAPKGIDLQLRLQPQYDSQDINVLKGESEVDHDIPHAISTRLRSTNEHGECTRRVSQGTLF